MKSIIKNCFSLLIILSLFTESKAQSADYATSKEKIYIHTSHVFFTPGDNLFFKLYLVNAANQKPTRQSSIAYVEIVSPSGTILQKMNYQVANGYTEGSFDIPASAPGGIYKIRAYSGWMQNEKQSTWFEKEITVQRYIAPRVLMKLEFPRKGYGPGDEVIADYSIRNLIDQPIRYKDAAVTVSVAGKEIMKRSISTNQEGKSVIKFRLPADLNSTDGLLNVTVTEDGYTESISRSIPIVLNKIDLQFMPEGGTLVAGMATNVAFKAVNEHGKAADIRGEIVDDLGNRITGFESFHFGMGRFRFTPQKGRIYSARILSPVNIHQTYTLPPATESGVVMNIIADSLNAVITINATSAKKFTLAGTMKNTEYYRADVNYQQGEFKTTVQSSTFPTGIVRFTLYNEQNEPLAERICFLNNHRLLNVSIHTDKERYQPREQVNMTIRSFDGTTPVPSNLSIAVMDDKLWSMADDKQDHIISWLLMSSELRGKVEEPQFYFKPGEQKATAALDLVMLTHGYRYFDYIEAVEKEKQVQFTPDLQNILSGVVTDLKGNPVRASVYLVNILTAKRAMEITTGEDGIFFFSDLESAGKYYLLARSLNKNESIKIDLQKNGPIANSRLTSQYNAITLPYTGLVPLEPVNDGTKKGKTLIQEMNFTGKANALQEVVIVGYAAANKKHLAGAVTVTGSEELRAIPSIEVALQGRVAGLAITQSFNPGATDRFFIRGASSISGNNQPMFIVDGVPVSNLSPHLLPAEVSSITVLKDAQATAIYGSRAANGVIIIETKRSFNERLKIDLTKPVFYSSLAVTTPGNTLSVARRFYAPVYETTATETRTDFRETIYWNPVIQTNKTGEASFSFYNSDASTTFRAIAEGIGYNGLTGRAESTFSTQAAMTVDAKIPPYLTVGDRALIPVVVKNNTDQTLTGSVSLAAGDSIRVGYFPSSLAIEPNGSLQVLIPIEATSPYVGQVRIRVVSNRQTESLSLPVVASAKGFPVYETISGNKSGDHPFTINKMVPGSLNASLKLFTSLEGQLLDGIESMLREPYGCFEQTSSTTYPNIFILKYLKQSGRANAAIEKKAKDYLSRGYDRLKGFETNAGGFEWFGNTPPHEALTAYGLLEFTDMQEFINVDKAMLQRTRDFLLNRRDGKGGFMSSAQGYDRFASVPNKIANIYIVYALTQAGVRAEIIKEYEAAVSAALAGDDAYQLAMMALAASNMKNDSDFKRLMSRLDENYRKKGLSSETSVVSSRDASLKIETVALYTLALARESSPRVGQMAVLVSQLLNQKSYYGYGSTQATVLALNAIVEYARLRGTIMDNPRVNFILNETTVQAESDVKGQLREGNNNFTVRYEDENKAYPFGLDVSYYTFTPPNSEKAELALTMRLNKQAAKVGETVRMEIEVANKKATLQPMSIAKIGIPAGLTFQSWQLKELIEKNQVTYYEIFDNYLVFYWLGFSASETKKINLDLKAEIPGSYKGKAGNTYLYYTPEHKHWNDGIEITIQP